ncbi:MAG TPA: methylmalonyl-CoA epimerase [Acidimicrobiales bacterium]|nr:methylmalonyl-CoA epimerase [Acidimicrobiales bacterium]
MTEPSETQPLLTEIDHVAIAVHDIDAAIEWYRGTLGARVAHREVVEHDGVEEALLKVAESYVQLVAPTRENSPVARFLAARGEGLHHVAYRVQDCATALQAVKRAGNRVIDEAPRPGSRGTTIAFVHPKSSFGTLVELVQEPQGAGAGVSPQ